MAKVRIEFNSGEFRKLLTSPAVQADIEARVEAIASAAGDGFEAFTTLGRFGGGRHVGQVVAVTTEAMKAEAEDKALSRAIDAGR